MSQPRLYPIGKDVSRSEHSLRTNLNARLEAENKDSVKASVFITLESGNNPVCATDNEKELTFKARSFNTGTTPTYEWIINNTVQISGTDSIFRYSSWNNNDMVQCRVTSSLSCNSGTSATSSSIKVEVSNDLKPELVIGAINNSNTVCEQNDPVTFTGILKNAGSGNTIEWFLNGVKTEITGNVFIADTMSNRRYVQAFSNTSSTCNTVSTIASDIVFRDVVRNLSPTVLLSIDNILNPDCGNNLYTFKATPRYAGKEPVYSWFLNNVFVASTTSPIFSIYLPQNGDELKARLTSSLSCANPVSVFSNIYQKADTLSIPFFDDFSTSTNQPSRQRWIKNEGTYINNTYAINQPTYNTATFDGLKYNGSAYDTINTNTRGIADKLTSLPINLSQITEESKKTVFLSFYWQAKGLGDAPEGSESDALTLYFKNINNEWIRVWEKIGSMDTNFTKAVVPLVDTTSNNYFHRSFQFKFESTGRLSGTFDVWNVDYIYLNANRSLGDTFFLDQSFSKQPIVVLPYGYSSIPYKHFAVLEDTLKTANVDSKLKNLGSSPNNITYRAVGRVDDFSKNFLEVSTEISPLAIFSVRANMDKLFFENIPTNTRSEAYLDFNVVGDLDNVDGKGIPYSQNNTLSTKIIFDNFYSYDDGSAEYGIGLNQKFAVMGYKYQMLKKPDTLRQIAVHFTQLGKVLVDQTINFFGVTKIPTLGELNTNNLPAHVLFNESFTIKYANGMNSWTVYELNEPVIVNSDTLYIGFKQITDDPLAIGWDRNTNSADKIIYNIGRSGTQWDYYTDSKGSLMLRPVFGNFNYVSSISKNDSFEKITLYPNPIGEILYCSESIQKITIYNTLGQEILKYESGGNEFDVSALSPGMYIAVVNKNNRSLNIKLFKN